jgi:hypothetical protein
MAVAHTPGARSTRAAQDRSGCSDTDLLKRHVTAIPEAFGELFLYTETGCGRSHSGRWPIDGRLDALQGR